MRHVSRLRYLGWMPLAEELYSAPLTAASQSIQRGIGEAEGCMYEAEREDAAAGGSGGPRDGWNGEEPGR